MEKDKLKLIMDRKGLDSLKLGDVVGVKPLIMSDDLDLLTVKGQDNGNLRVLEGVNHRGRLDLIIEWIVPKKEIIINREGSITFYVTQSDYGVYHKTDRKYSELKTLMQESGVI